MSIQDISNMFGFIGGLGMFLYGMTIMADGMQKSAGNKMKTFLGMLTNNRFLAVGLGALITAIIQSSGATTVMVVGFVNAGVLTLAQAVGVIMGANIGTTITAWIVSMSQLGDAMSVFSPSFIAPLLIGVGGLTLVFAKKEKLKDSGEIFIGLGLLFIGLDFMSGSISPYTGSPIFSKAFAVLGGNPILGIIIGALVTALLQSSSASVGILQTLAMNGVVTTNAAIFITLGQNIGSCVTALISSAGANKTAKRAAIIHLSFNVIGSTLFGIIAFVLFTVNKNIATSMISSVQISIFHTIFNLSNTILLFPFANQLVKLSSLIIKEDKEETEPITHEEMTHRHLDERIFESPSFAMETARLEISHMGHRVFKNAKRALEGVKTGDKKLIATVFEAEKEIDSMQNMLTEYLIKLNNLSLTEEQKKIVNNFFYTINDIERIGDHVENIAEQADYMQENHLRFTETGYHDLQEIGDVVLKAVETAVEARQYDSIEAIRKVTQYEDEVDSLEEEFRDKHIERLSNNECQPPEGMVFLDIISNLERMADHAYNIAKYVKDEI